MFNSNNWQVKLVYAGFGGFLMLVGMVLSPVTAQREKFGEIVCTKLSVVDRAGVPRVVLSTNVYDGLHAGRNKRIVTITSGEIGGSKIEAFGEHGGRASLSTIHGFAEVAARGIDGAARLVPGSVYCDDDDGTPLTRLRATEHGGRVDVFGKSKGTAVMKIDEHGNGVVSTWDKNGYRQK